MKIDLHSGEICLAGGRPLRLSEARGVRVTCLFGTIWITMAGEVADLILHAGDSCQIARNGLTLIESIGCGRLRLERPAPSWIEKLWGATGHTGLFGHGPTATLHLRSAQARLSANRTDRAAADAGFPA